MAGVVLSERGEEEAGLPSAARVVFRAPDGAEQELTPAEAAAKIERLLAVAARPPRARAAAPEEESEEPPPPPPSEAVNVPVPTRPDGREYSVAELRELAQAKTADPALRLAAIRALRRDDSPEARTILTTLLEDGETPLDARIEAAKALAKPPHRDQTPDELVRLLSSPDLPPEARLEVAEGVTRLRDRGAFMSEIASQFGKEKDPEVRKLLFDTVQRNAWDPAAKLELVSMIGNNAVPLEDRRAAVLALARQGGDRKVLEALRPLLTENDAGLRENAVLALARADRLTLEQIAAAMGDDHPAVRAAALAARLPGGKNVPKEERDAALAMAVRLATGDASPDVRRAALGWTGAMPKEVRDQVLEAARSDSDPLVRIEAYQRSPAEIVRQSENRVLADLDSADPRVRDAAYRLVVKTWNVDVPYRAAWNPKARAEALRAIRAQVGLAR
jgi:hypothetical protein